MTQVSPFVVPDVGGDILKVDIIKGAYSKLRISGLTVDPTPSDLELALKELESFMAEIFARNMVLGYNFEDDPDPNTPTGVIRSYQFMMETNLAVRLISDFNKTVPQALLDQASGSYSTAAGQAMLEKLNQVQPPRRQARGSGNTLRYNRWSRFYRLFNANINNPAQKTIFIGDINDFEEKFDAYLNTGEVIASYDIVADPGLILSNDSNDDESVFYRIEGSNPLNNSALSQLVTIIITTSNGRVETRQILFEVVQRFKDRQ